jgi:lactate dehydrogenase-like 2-hydroxyacid dehydrogenase
MTKQSRKVVGNLDWHWVWQVKTLALLGLGRLGAACVKTVVYGFGMKVTAWEYEPDARQSRQVG